MIMFTFAVVLVSEESQDSQAAIDKANKELIGSTEEETIESIEKVSPPSGSGSGSHKGSSCERR